MAIESEKYKGYTIEIDYDPDAENPRTNYTHGCELVLSHMRYDVPNESEIDFKNFDSMEEVQAELDRDENNILVLPVWGYDHSGVAFSVGDREGQFADRWDSGQFGYAVLTKKNWEETQGAPYTNSEEDQAQALRLIQGDVKEYAAYFNGWVYTYAVKDEDGDIVESCAGFYDTDDAINQAKSWIDATTK